jgi:hypothetical protein
MKASPFKKVSANPFKKMRTSPFKKMRASPFKKMKASPFKKMRASPFKKMRTISSNEPSLITQHIKQLSTHLLACVLLPSPLLLIPIMCVPAIMLEVARKRLVVQVAVGIDISTISLVGITSCVCLPPQKFKHFRHAATPPKQQP